MTDPRVDEADAGSHFPTPPPISQWVCMVVIVGWVVAVWFLWR